MAAPAAVLQILVTANATQANATLAKTQAQLKGTAATAASTGAAMRSRLATGAKYGALALAGIGAASVKAAVDFDRSMRNVNSIAQLNERQLGKLEDRVKSLAGRTAQSPDTLAEGLYDLVSSGFNANESMKVLASSAKAATAGLTDTATSTKAVAAVLNAYRMPAAKAASVSDTLFQTVNLGVISFDELASTIGDVLPFASSLGVGLDQLGASISTMTKAGISPAETMTRLKAIMSSLIKPSEQMAATLRQMGYESGEALIKQKGLQGALDALAKTTGGSKEAMAALFPNIRALGGALALTGENSKQANKDLAGFADTSGATAKALAEQSKSVAFQWNKLKAQAQVLAINIGDTLLPELREMLEILTNKKLTLDEKVAKLGTKLTETIEKWAPQAAKAGAAVAGAIIKGIWNAFWHSDLLGKLFIGAAALRLFGGAGVFRTLGGKMAGWLFAGFASSAAGGAATGAGGTAAGGIAGGILAGVKTFLPRAGMTALGVAAAAELMHGISDGIKRQSSDVQEALDAIVPDSLSGPGLIEGVFGTSEETKHAQELKNLLSHILTDKIGISEQTRAEMMKQGRLIGLTDQQLAQADRILGYGEQRLKQSEQLSDIFGGMEFNLSGQDILPQKTIDQVQARLDQLGRGMFTSQDQIKTVMRENRKNILSLNQPAAKTGKMLGENMRAGAQAMRKALHNGSIRGVENIRDAREKIRHLLRSADLVEGIHPKDFGRTFAKAIKAGRGATKDGIDKIIGDLMKMPKDARNAAFQTMMAQLREFKRGGKLSDREFRDIRAKLLVRLKGITSDGRKQSGFFSDLVSGNFASLAENIYGGLQNIGSNVGKVLDSFNVEWQKYSLQKPSGGGGKPQKRQTGGVIVPGQGSGDKVPALLEPGEVVWNRNAVAVMGGAARADRINKRIPRFASGGVVTGDTDYSKEMAQAMNALAAGTGRNIFVQSGGRTLAEQAALYQAYLNGTGNLAAPPNPNAPHVQGIAADITPGQSVFGGVAGKYGLGFPVPGESWHIQLMDPSASSGARAGSAKIARVLLKGPKGPLRDLGQAALDKTVRAARQFVASKMPTGGGGFVSAGGGGSVVAQMGRILLANHFSRAGAAGIIGNAYRESLWDPGAVGTGGGGLFGFTTSPVSLADLQSFAKRKGTSWKNVATQMEFMLANPGGGGLMTDDYYNNLEGFLKSTKDVHDATFRFMDEWERPGIPAFEDRLAGAQKSLGMFRRGGIVQRLQKGGKSKKPGKGTATPGPTDPAYKRFVKAQRFADKLKGLVGEKGRIARLDERIQIAETMAGLDSSELGSDLGPNERQKQIRLNEALLARMVMARKLARTGLHWLDFPKGMSTAAIKPSQLKGLKGRFTQTLLDLTGLTGRSGRIFDTRMQLDALKHTSTTGAAAEALDISGLRAMLEAARYGVFDGYYAKGGTIGRGKWGVVGENGPEIVHGPATVTPSPQVTVENNFDWEGMDLYVTTTVDGQIAKREKLSRRRARQMVR